MFIRSLLVLLALAPSLSHAEWKVINKVVNVDTKDPEIIANAMPDFTYLLNHVVARELTHPSKLMVYHFQGAIDLVKWENDSTCTVPDASLVPYKNVTPFAKAEFYFADSPESHHANMVQEMLFPPCGPNHGEEKSRKVSQD